MEPDYSTTMNTMGLVEQAVNRMTTTGWGQMESSGPCEMTWEMVEQTNEGLCKILYWLTNQHVTQKLELHEFICNFHSPCATTENSINNFKGWQI